MLDRVTMVLIFVAGATLTVLAGNFGLPVAMFKGAAALIILVGTIVRIEEYWSEVLNYLALAEFTTVQLKQEPTQPDAEKFRDILYALVFVFVLIIL